MMPRQLFKYCMADHAEAIVKHGCLRIGTLAEYRAAEAAGETWGDAQEGTFTRFAYDVTKVHRGPRLDEFEEDAIMRTFGPMGPNVEFAHNDVGLFERIPDAWSFCASLEWDPLLLSRLDYDACVIIQDPLRFLGELESGLVLIAAPIQIGRITYRSREQDHREAHPGTGFVKPVAFGCEREFRAIAMPLRHDALDPMLVCMPAIRGLAARIC